MLRLPPCAREDHTCIEIQEQIKMWHIKYLTFSNLIVSAHVNYGDIFSITFHSTFTLMKYLTR